MHQFGELVWRSIGFVMAKLDELEDETIKELETSGATIHIKNLQALNMQRVINAVGAFAIFEAHLQDQFFWQHKIETMYAFDEARKKLKEKGRVELEDRFGILIEAIHILKHGKGKSYEKLLKRQNLPFRIKQPGENFFDEGDVSEVQTLIFVDREFVSSCLQVINDVSTELDLW